jgi:hypothetical protein
VTQRTSNILDSNQLIRRQTGDIEGSAPGTGRSSFQKGSQMGDVIAFPGTSTAVASAQAEAGLPLASVLDSCREGLGGVQAVLLPIEAYFERLDAALAEADLELQRAAGRHALCLAALASGDIDTMLRARDALIADEQRPA